MLHLDLFSGIGGFALAADRVWPGIEHIFCDNDLFCQEVLKKHWPDSKIYGDINDFIKICEKHAPTVKTRNEPPTLIGGRNVLQKPRETDYMEAKNDTKNTNKESGKLPEGLGLWSTRLMEESVVAVVNQSHLFSPLTTLTEEERKKEKNLWDSNSTGTSKTTTSQKDTNFSATTAITENTDLEYAHTNNHNITNTTGNRCSRKGQTFEVEKRYEEESRQSGELEGRLKGLCGSRIDILTAGVPCQPASQAGRRRGKEDDRWLWPQTFTTIKLTKPTWVILENVRGLLTLERGLVFKELLVTLEGLGYEAVPLIIPAVSVNAPHRRDRVWIVANRRLEYGGKGGNERMEADKTKRTTRPTDIERQDKDATDTSNQGLERRSETLRQKEKRRSNPRHSSESNGWNENWLEVATSLCRMDDGLPSRLDRTPRLKALGNAIVSQVAAEIMLAIRKTYD